jgi:hypothetical protein
VCVQLGPFGGIRIQFDPKELHPLIREIGSEEFVPEATLREAKDAALPCANDGPTTRGRILKELCKGNLEGLSEAAESVEGRSAQTPPSSSPPPFAALGSSARARAAILPLRVGPEF